MKIRLKFNQKFYLIDPGFFQKKMRYVFQSLLAVLSLFLVLIVGGTIAHGAVIAGIASTTALIFFAPLSYASSSRRIIGGHILGVAVASVSFLIFSIFFPVTTAAPNVMIYLYCSISLGVLITLMGILNCEHAPAAGCLLGLNLQGLALDTILFIIISAFVLASLRILLIKWIRNLI